jgi:hypothetical protein
MENLHEIGLKYGTDKAYFHEFTKVYEDIFSEHRHKKIKFLEVGIWVGSSLIMWEEYFTNAIIYGADKFTDEERIDISKKYLDGKYKDIKFNDLKTKTFVVDQEIESELLTLPNDLDIIIEDGGHTMIQQQISLNTLFMKKLKSGGIYILEDLHTSNEIYWESYGGNSKNNTLRLLKDLSEKSLSYDNDYYINDVDFQLLVDEIDSIEIFKVKENSITSIIRKK